MSFICKMLISQLAKRMLNYVTICYEGRYSLKVCNIVQNLAYGIGLLCSEIILFFFRSYQTFSLIWHFPFKDRPDCSEYLPIGCTAFSCINKVKMQTVALICLGLNSDYLCALLYYEIGNSTGKWHPVVIQMTHDIYTSSDSWKHLSSHPGSCISYIPKIFLKINLFLT